MDGVAFVRAQMARRPVPIIIISIASQAGEQVLAALDAGAIDFVQKPTALATDKLLDIADELMEKVKAAAQAPLRVAGSRSPLRCAPIPPGVTRQARQRRHRASSASRPADRRRSRSSSRSLPADFPVPIAMVLHMPVGYTEMYAAKLNELSPLTVVEAKGGEEVVPGMVFLAPAGRHLTFRRDADGIVRTASTCGRSTRRIGPRSTCCSSRPPTTYGAGVLGVVMTGMGADGREGAAWIKAKGGRVITEAEETCVVYGMPRSVVEAGLSDDVVPLESMADVIMERV